LNRYQRKNIAAMQGYTWGEQPDDDLTIKLNTNENPYPPSPAVQAALAALDVARLRTYPQPTADPLRDAIAARHGIERNNIIVTNGGDEALRLALTTYVESGQGFGMASPSYSLYPVLADIHGARVVEVALEADWALPDHAAARLNDAGAQLTCVVNPHAPSGALTDTDSLARLARNLDGVLLIDEAYADFIDPDKDYDSVRLLNTHDNVLILRSFSKGYSLAGLRLGYLLGAEELIEPIVTKTRDSYNIDHISQVLGQAAFEDIDYAHDTWAKVREQRTVLRNDLAQLGLHAPASQANFLLAAVSDASPRSARELYAYLKDNGILVRYFDMPGLRDKLRITVGTAQQNERLIAALTDALT